MVAAGDRREFASRSLRDHLATSSCDASPDIEHRGLLTVMGTCCLPVKSPRGDATWVALPLADLPGLGEAVKKYRLGQAEWVSEVKEFRDG